MATNRRNALALALVDLVFWILLLSISFEAVNLIHEPWRAVDYWYAWFAGFTLVGSVIYAIAFGVQLYVALGGEYTQGR